MTNLFGNLAVIASFSSIFIGTSLQIYKNWSRKNCKGLSLTAVVNLWLCNLFWGAYGYCKGDFCLIITNPPSILLVSVILWQFFIYRKNKG